MKIMIKTKIFLFVAFTSFIMGFMGYYANVQMHFLDDQGTRLYEKMTLPLGQIAGIANLNGSIQGYVWHMLYRCGKTGDIELLAQKISGESAIVEKNCYDYKATLINAEDEINYNKLIELKTNYFTELFKIVSLVKSAKKQEAQDLFHGVYDTAASAFDAQIDKMIEINVKAAKRESDENTIVCNAALSTMFNIIAGAIIMSLIIGFSIADGIGKILNRLIADCTRLTNSTLEGKLNVRGNVEETNFEFKPIVQGINNTLDAVMVPLYVTAEYVDKISKGDIPQKITDEYKGDFKEIKNNLNQCIDAITLLIDDANKLANDAIDGKFNTRADILKHRGDFKKIIDGVNKTLDRFMTIMVPIDELTQKKEQLKASLAEKEALLRELYHRTKNNMQVICAMLMLYSSQTNNLEAISAFREIDLKIRTMALVHKKLYESNDLSNINLKEYVHDLCALFEKSYGIISKQIELELNVEEISVTIDIAIPCGLVINELFSNTFKYAFPEGSQGKIKLDIKLTPEKYIDINYSDNGIGLPSGFDFRRDGRMGIQSIVSIIENQLQGSFSISSGKGFSCELKFKKSLYEIRV
ncbi:MAG TPA: MCP four helix bundle domain-containing protein [Candidatus Wallbacteria bacterium]|nr:MCP four helix bundle domain-containing protein [Candidatus Wallbacteria bacterium]